MWAYHNRINSREVSTIMRFLGAYPSEKDMVEKILPDVRIILVA
jgi:hypothetical protein